MFPNLRHLFRACALFFPLLAGPALMPTAMANDSDEDPPSLEALLAETDALIEGDSSSLDSLPEPEDPSDLLVFGTVQAGPGYSSNYLRAAEEVDSFFLHVETDIWLSWLKENKTFTALAYAETHVYEEETEYLTLSQFNGKVSLGAFDLGTEAMVIYGEEVYDSSNYYLDTAPVGTLIEEFIPEVNVFMDWFAGKRHRLALEVAVRRAEFSVQDQDFWEPLIRTEWEFLLRPGLRVETRLAFSKQYYDDDFPRYANSFAIPGTSNLEVDELDLRQELTWEPKDHDWLRVRLSAGLSWESDEVGDYKDMRQAWAAFHSRLKTSIGNFSINLYYSDQDYSRRQVGFFDTTRVKRIQRRAKLEYERILHDDWSMVLSGEWTFVDSRISYDTFEEQRVMALLKWAY